MASCWCPKLQNSTESHFETVHHFDRLRGEGKRGCPAQLRTWPQGFRKQEVYNTCNKHSDLQCYSAHKYKYFAIAMLLQSYSRQSVWFFCQINIWWVDHQSWLLQLVHLSTSNWKPLSPSVQSCLRSEHGRCSTLFNIKEWTDIDWFELYPSTNLSTHHLADLVSWANFYLKPYHEERAFLEDFGQPWAQPTNPFISFPFAPIVNSSRYNVQ